MFTIRRRVSNVIPFANLKPVQTQYAKTLPGVVYPWTPQDEDDDTEYYDVPAKSPRETFQPLIDKYRSLQYISRPTNAEEGEFQLFIDEWQFGLPDHAPDEARELLEGLHTDWQLSRGLEEIYFECGWRTDQVDQSAFRREEFLEKRQQHLFGLKCYSYCTQAAS
jgi:hypothetical protein